MDRRDLGGGVKNWEWIKKGVPLRVEIGPRDIASGNAMVSRRDQPVKAKELMSIQELVFSAPEILASIQRNLFERAKKFRDENTCIINSREEFYDFFTPKNSAKPEIHGGFAVAYWNGSREVDLPAGKDESAAGASSAGLGGWRAAGGTTNPVLFGRVTRSTRRADERLRCALSRDPVLLHCCLGQKRRARLRRAAARRSRALPQRLHTYESAESD